MFEQEIDPKDGRIVYHIDSAHGSLNFKMEKTDNLSVFHPVIVTLLSDVPIGPELQISDIEDLIGGLIMLHDIMLNKTIKENRRRGSTVETMHAADLITNLEHERLLDGFIMGEETNDESQ